MYLLPGVVNVLLDFKSFEITHSMLLECQLFRQNLCSINLVLICLYSVSTAISQLYQLEFMVSLT